MAHSVGDSHTQLIMWPSLGAALIVVSRPSVCLSVRPSRVSDFLEIGKAQELLI